MLVILFLVSYRIVSYASSDIELTRRLRLVCRRRVIVKTTWNVARPYQRSHAANQRDETVLSTVYRGVYSDTTQLNSTPS